MTEEQKLICVAHESVTAVTVQAVAGTNIINIPTTLAPSVGTIAIVAGTTVNIFNGTSWTDGTPYVFNGTAWVEADTVYVFNGTAWVEKD